MKEFELKDADNVIKPRANKKLQDEAVERIKETKHVTASDYVSVVNPKKKNNRVKEVEPELVKAKEENHLGVPNSFYNLDVQEQTMLMLYLSPDFINPLTGNRTHMNVLESYVATYLDEKEIEDIWEVVQKKDKRYVTQVKSPKKYAQLKKNAVEAFSNPVLKETWNDMVRMTFGANPEDMLKNAILQDALYAEKSSDKNANRKMALDIFKVSEKEQNNTLNVFVQGGGKEMADVLRQAGDEYVTTEDDLEVNDDE